MKACRPRTSMRNSEWTGRKTAKSALLGWQQERIPYSYHPLLILGTSGTSRRDWEIEEITVQFYFLSDSNRSIFSPSIFVMRRYALGMGSVSSSAMLTHCELSGNIPVASCGLRSRQAGRPTDAAVPDTGYRCEQIPSVRRFLPSFSQDPVFPPPPEIPRGRGLSPTAFA